MHNVEGTDMVQDKTTTQMAARFLKQARNKLPYIVLLKMLYLADRQMLIQYGEPITFDKWVSMENGPLLSGAYDQNCERSGHLIRS